MNGRKFYIFNAKTRPLEMVLIKLQQQIYRSAKWIVNAANTIRLIMHYYIYVRLMQNKVMTYVHYDPLCPKPSE